MTQFSREQKMQALAEREAGLSLNEICQKYRISRKTFLKWKEEERMANLERVPKADYDALLVEHQALHQQYRELKEKVAIASAQLQARRDLLLRLLLKGEEQE